MARTAISVIRQTQVENLQREIVGDKGKKRSQGHRYTIQCNGSTRLNAIAQPLGHTLGKRRKTTTPLYKFDLRVRTEKNNCRWRKGILEKSLVVLADIAGLESTVALQESCAQDKNPDC